MYKSEEIDKKIIDTFERIDNLISDLLGPNNDIPKIENSIVYLEGFADYLFIEKYKLETGVSGDPTKKGMLRFIQDSIDYCNLKLKDLKKEEKDYVYYLNYRGYLLIQKDRILNN